MATDAIAEELTELYIDWALSEEREPRVPARWQQLARELKRRHKNAADGNCTCEDCCADWPVSEFGNS